VEGEFRPPVTGPLATLADRDGDRWKAFRFDVRVGLNLEPARDGTPRLKVDVEEVKRRELEGVAGVLARFLGRHFDEIVTHVVSGKATHLSEKFNAEIRRKIAAFQDYGVFDGIDYGPEQVVLRFDLTRLKREGIAGYVAAAPGAETVPIHRWIHRRRGSHLYAPASASPDPNAYQDEGVVFHALDHPHPQAVPLTHWSTPRDHFYTTAADGEGVGARGYRLDGVACFIAREPVAGAVALYRFIDPRTGQHFYSTHPHAEFAK
jgi:hypothetical protein